MMTTLLPQFIILNSDIRCGSFHGTVIPVWLFNPQPRQVEQPAS